MKFNNFYVYVFNIVGTLKLFSKFRCGLCVKFLCFNFFSILYVGNYEPLYDAFVCFDF